MNNYIILILMILFILISNYYTLKIGASHYNSTDKFQLFDVFHNILPDLYEYHYLVDIFGILGFLSLFIFLDKPIIIEFFSKFIIIMFIRAFTIISTILPKHETCPDEFYLRSYLLGGCYDKIFSGHTSFILLMTLMYYREYIIDMSSLIGINLLNILLILATRSHYTVDIILATFVTLTVFNIHI